MPQIRWMAVALGGWLVACAPGSFDPPSAPAHDRYEDGYAHAAGKDVPFLCLDPSTGRRAACPDVWPDDPRQLSCDAAGCHGDHTYEPGLDPDGRHLLGSDGPSCNTCHGREWSGRKE